MVSLLFFDANLHRLLLHQILEMLPLRENHLFKAMSSPGATTAEIKVNLSNRAKDREVWGYCFIPSLFFFVCVCVVCVGANDLINGINRFVRAIFETTARVIQRAPVQYHLPHLCRRSLQEALLAPSSCGA